MANPNIQGNASVSALKASLSAQAQSASRISNSFDELNQRISFTIRTLQKKSAEVLKSTTRVIKPDKIDVKV